MEKSSNTSFEKDEAEGDCEYCGEDSITCLCKYCTKCYSLFEYCEKCNAPCEAGICVECGFTCKCYECKNCKQNASLCICKNCKKGCKIDCMCTDCKKGCRSLCMCKDCGKCKSACVCECGECGKAQSTCKCEICKEGCKSLCICKKCNGCNKNCGCYECKDCNLFFDYRFDHLCSKCGNKCKCVPCDSCGICKELKKCKICNDCKCKCKCDKCDKCSKKCTKKGYCYENLFYSYTWHHDEKIEEGTDIRIYGMNDSNENVCVRVRGYQPYVYMELPSKINWVQSIRYRKKLVEYISNRLKEHKPLNYKIFTKKKLYGSHKRSDGTDKTFQFMRCRFASSVDRRKFNNLFYFSYKGRIPGIVGQIPIKIHEYKANPILQLTCERNLPSSNWIGFNGKKLAIGDPDKITSYENEYIVDWNKLFHYNSDESPQLKVMGYDIEVNSHDITKFPSALNPKDEIFQIACTISHEGVKNVYKKYLLSLGNPIQSVVGDDVIVQKYVSEEDLLLGYKDLVKQEQPNIICGYNIFKFDIPYMIERAHFNRCIRAYSQQGAVNNKRDELKTIKWSSKAFQKQEYSYLDVEGVLFIDLLPIIQRAGYKLNNFKLKTVANHFIGETKDPLSVKGIFMCYRKGMAGGKAGDKAMGVVGKYCVQDATLVNRLMENIQIWTELTEMATICNVPPFVLYTQGQQIRVYSQVYKYCIGNDIIVESDGYKCKPNERYVGAYVFDPVPGLYDMVVPFDFASLYPTTIIAYNICYSTFVTDPNIPDSKCHVMEWEDHVCCEHDESIIKQKQLVAYILDKSKVLRDLREKKKKIKDQKKLKKMKKLIAQKVEELKPYKKELSSIKKKTGKNVMCEKRRYRYLKEPKGAIPIIIQDLLDARANTRKNGIAKNKEKIKELEAKQSTPESQKEIEKLKELNKILNKRQLSYKVSANSMYGAMGVRDGYLPFMPGAMCTTYMGRTNIMKVADVITKKFGGELIYGDTDSNYIHFPKIKEASEVWDYAIYVADEVSKMFPAPIKLEFEEALYVLFFILSKKRYAYQESMRDGIISGKVGTKGILLSRGDNARYIRNVYGDILKKLIERNDMDQVIYNVLDWINKLFSFSINLDDFIITKSAKSVDAIEPVPFINEKGIKKAKIGHYTTPLLPDDPLLKEYMIKKKGAVDEKDFYTKCLPAPVQLNEKMKRRGLIGSDAGSKVEYVITDFNSKKQYEKVEHVSYFKMNRDILRIDFFNYLSLLVNPLDEILNVAFCRNPKYPIDLVKNQLKYREKIRGKMLQELKNVFSPEIVMN